jgi:Collagen triple helix repeat (20 copies)
MRKYILVSVAFGMLGLTACDRPTVIIPATPVAVPGPAGPAGATGSQGNEGSKGATGMQGNQGTDGTKGDTGKTGTGGAAIVIVPAETPPAK